MIKPHQTAVARPSSRELAEIGSGTIELAMSFHGEPVGDFVSLPCWLDAD